MTANNLARPSLRPLPHRLVVAYHGTTRTLGEAVLLGSAELTPKSKPWHWLGQGVYFWEHGPARAYEWASAHIGPGESPYVLGAYIDLGVCLDLTDTWATELLAGAFALLRLSLESQRLPMPRNVSGRGAAPGDRLVRSLDCAVIDMANQLADDEAGRTPGARRFQTVRGVFEEGPAAFEGAGVRRRTHVQIAVRDMDCVLGYFRPA